jgi:hypothetical protein
LAEKSSSAKSKAADAGTYDFDGLAKADFSIIDYFILEYTPMNETNHRASFN